MKKLLTIILITLISAVLSATGAVAGKKRIKPSDLKPYISNSVYYQDSRSVKSASDTTAVSFWAEVKLPVGKKVTELAYYHSGYAGSVSPEPSTAVWLWKTNFAGETEMDPVMLARSSDYVDVMGKTLLVKTTELADAMDIGINKIRKGDIFYIKAYSDNDNSYIHGIEITYK